MERNQKIGIMTSKIKLGPIQRLWVKSLKEHPERQMSDRLGKGNSKDYKACCLGEALVCYNRYKKLKLPFSEGSLIDLSPGRFKYHIKLSSSFKKLGLIDNIGSFKQKIYIRKNNEDNKGYTSLANMNDKGIPWLEIAKIIEKYPDLIFTKSV